MTLPDIKLLSLVDNTLFKIEFTLESVGID